MNSTIVFSHVPVSTGRPLMLVQIVTGEAKLATVKAITSALGLHSPRLIVHTCLSAIGNEQARIDSYVSDASANVVTGIKTTFDLDIRQVSV